MNENELDKTVYFSPDLSNAGEKMVLSVFEGNKPVRQIDLFSFHKSIISIGRSDNNDIVIPSPIVSRRHG